MNGHNLYWFQDGFEISDANWHHSLATSPDLDKINEHARTFSDDVGKELFRIRKKLLLGRWDENASPHILTGTHKSNYCK